MWKHFYFPLFFPWLAAAASKPEIRCDVPDSQLLPASRNSRLESPTGRLAIFEKGQHWPNGTVYFTIDQDKLTDRQIGVIYQAFMEYHDKTCIRFKPWKNSGSSNYIRISSTENGACSLADVCMKGGEQMVQLGGPCWFKGMVIHQLGHALCLGHEHQRPIRDQYLGYKPSCPNNEVPDKMDDDEGQIGFYDYASQMHFGCGWCGGGWPKDGNFTKCGHQVTDGLSLLDADYLNLIYGCGGCHRHRWVPLDKLLLPENKRQVHHMHSFGLKDRLGDDIFPCRVSLGGEIIIGKFTWRHKTCSFSLGGKEYYQKGQGTEILLIPGGLKAEDGTSEYRIEDVTDYSEDIMRKLAVPAGRLPEREDYGQGYVAFGRVRSPVDWEHEDVIGKAWERDGKIPQAFFPLGGKEVSAYFFKVLTCHQHVKQ